MPEPELTRAERNALYRALGHPLRRRILDHLGRHGEANSTALAEALGQSTGTTSYHLRKLADLRLIGEVPERARGRERWWRLLSGSPDGPAAAPEERAARLGHDMELYVRATREQDGAAGWARIHRHATRLTAEELHAFLRDYRALIERYGRERDGAPEGARTVAFRFYCVPDEVR